MTYGPVRVADDLSSANVSVEVRAVLRNGRRQHFRGNYSLFRPVDLANDASAWRITAGCLSSAGRGGCAY